MKAAVHDEYRSPEVIRIEDPGRKGQSPTMLAVQRDRYGNADVLELGNVPVPVCAGNEVLIRGRAASLNPYDWHMMTGTPLLTRLQGGFTRPKQQILGLDVAGSVVAVGEQVTRFSVGDEVIALTRGALAEFVTANEDAAVAKPPDISYESAAATPVAALTALQGLRDYGQVAHGQRVLINGASGGVGTYAVQIAKALGAQVTGVTSARNVELVRSLGADQVVDYTCEDFAAPQEQYDVVLDNVGNRKLTDIKRTLKPSGTYVVVGGPKTSRVLGPASHMLKSLVFFVTSSIRAVSFMARPNHDDLAYLVSLLGDKTMTSVIDRTYPLEETANAMRHLATGHARGKIIIALEI